MANEVSRAANTGMSKKTALIVVGVLILVVALGAVALNLVPVPRSVRTAIVHDVTAHQGLRQIFEASSEEDLKFHYKGANPNLVIMKGSFTSKHNRHHLEELEVKKTYYGRWQFQYME